MAFEYLVDLEECVGILENFYDLITEDRGFWLYEGDLILPARSALEIAWENGKGDLTEKQAESARNFSAYAISNRVAFNNFFSLDHARFNPETALDGWVVDASNKEVVRIPHFHWWWKPLKETDDD